MSERRLRRYRARGDLTKDEELTDARTEAAERVARERMLHRALAPGLKGPWTINQLAALLEVSERAKPRSRPKAKNQHRRKSQPKYRNTVRRALQNAIDRGMKRPQRHGRSDTMLLTREQVREISPFLPPPHRQNLNCALGVEPDLSMAARLERATRGELLALAERLELPTAGGTRALRRRIVAHANRALKRVALHDVYEEAMVLPYHGEQKP